MPDAGDTESRPPAGTPSPPDDAAAPAPVPPAGEGETQPIDPALLQVARSEVARAAASSGAGTGASAPVGLEKTSTGGSAPDAGQTPAESVSAPASETTVVQPAAEPVTGPVGEVAAEEAKPKRLGPKPPEIRGPRAPEPTLPPPGAQPTTMPPAVGYRPPAGPPPGRPPMPPPPGPPAGPPPGASPWARPGGPQPGPGAPTTGMPHPGTGMTGQQPAIPAGPYPASGSGYAGGYGAPPPGGVPAGPGVTPRPMPARRSGKLGWIIAIVVALVLVFVGCAVGAIFLAAPNMMAQSIDKGECVRRASNNTLLPAACTASGALKVIDRLDDTTDGSKCPKATTTTVFTHRQGNDNYVLCLGKP